MNGSPHVIDIQYCLVNLPAKKIVMKEVTMTRQDLYDLVWKESMLALSKKYVISGTGLKKKCRALKIPVPEMGYWAKLKFGKAGAQNSASNI